MCSGLSLNHVLGIFSWFTSVSFINASQNTKYSLPKHAHLCMLHSIGEDHSIEKNGYLSFPLNVMCCSIHTFL